MAVELARQMDSKRNSATSKSMCGRVLVDVLARLRELAPQEEQQDNITDFQASLDAKRNAAAS